VDPAEYVLSGFSSREKEAAKMAQEEALNCCLCWAEEGLPQAMNKFNKKSDLIKKRKV
jgi:peptidyl-tRNA hydrolase